jgi:hypothetical protein
MNLIGGTARNLRPAEAKREEPAARQVYIPTARLPEFTSHHLARRREAIRMTHARNLSAAGWATRSLAILVALILGGLLPIAPGARADGAVVPLFTCAAQMVDGQQRGRLLRGDQEVLVIFVKAAGLSGYERASIVAGRLNDALKSGVTAAQIHLVQSAGMTALQAGPAILLTVTPEEAAAHHQTAVALAQVWLTALSATLAAVPAAPPVVTPPVVTPPAVAPPAYQDRVVPLVGDGAQMDVVPLVPDGAKMGLVRVSGPTATVAQVKCVAFLVTQYRQTLPIAVYVPLSTDAPGATLARVPGVGVTAGLPQSPPPSTSSYPPGNFATAVRILGPLGVVLHYAGSLNQTINDALAQHGAPLAGASKVVPIMEAGSQRAVGAAQITGPQAQLDLVRAEVASLVTLPGQPEKRALLPDAPAPDVYVSAVVVF